MIRIGITGAYGFLGWHLRALLHADPGIQAVPGGRDLFSEPSKLREFVGGVDAVVHLAGANRGEEREIRNTNIALTEQLVHACTGASKHPHIVFANSTHSARSTPYGESKRQAAATLAAWSEKSGALFANLVLPNVFGEGCRPFYNSAVATFCHQLARGEEPQLIEDIEIELIHAQEVAAAILAAIRENRTGEMRLQGTLIRVSTVLARLKMMAEQYAGGLLPELASEFDLNLFNTYRSYLFPRHYPVNLEQRQDARGSLFEAVKTLRGGQCFLSTTHPGITRGNHYHRRKLERFLVLHGDAVIRVRRLLGDDVKEFRVSGSRPQYVDIPTLHTHNIANVGVGELITLFWSQEIFDVDQPDTFSEAV